MTYLALTVFLVSIIFSDKIILFKLERFRQNPEKSHLVKRALYIAVVPFFLWGLVPFGVYLDYLGAGSCFSNISLIPEAIASLISLNSTGDGLGVLKIVSTLFVSLFGFFVLVLWNLKRTYEDKWRYCAKMFNEVVKFNVSNEYEFLMKENYRTCLAMDLELMGFHNHDSFKYLYKAAVKEAFKHSFDSLKEYQESLVKEISKIEEKLRLKKV